MPKAVKPTKVNHLSVDVHIGNSTDNNEYLFCYFSKDSLTITEHEGESIKISREFLPEFLAALQTTYPDAFALIDKHQKPQK